MNRFTLIGFLIALTGGVSLEAAGPKAIKMQVTDGESSVYILYDNGQVLTVGNAVNYGAPPTVSVADITLTPSGKGYYLLEKNGAVDSFGAAVQIGRAPSSTHSYVDMEITGDSEGFYFLRDDGKVITVGSAKFYGELVKAPAVDLQVALDSEGYYVLYQDGTLAAFGSAVNYGSAPSTLRKAVALELGNEGYYVLYDDGTVQDFGHAVPLPSTASSTVRIVDMALTSRGYRTLNEQGQTQSFFRIDDQGKISWYAQSTSINQPAAATPTPTATPLPTPTRTPLPGTKYFNFSQTGFSERIIGRLPVNTVIPQGLSTGQTAIPTGGTFLVVAANTDQPRRILYFSAADVTNADNPGTVFADLVTERGAALIRGISYNKLGLTVTVEENSVQRLLMIAGNFETTSVSGYTAQP